MQVDMQKKIINQNIEVIIGHKVKYFRIRRSMTQKVLGEAIGVTTQQIQKYEQGYNRISVSRLMCIAQFLKFLLKFFFKILILLTIMLILIMKIWDIHKIQLMS